MTTLNFPTTTSRPEITIPKIPVVVRAFEEEDRNFIGSAYMKDYWNHGIRGHHFRRKEDGKIIRMENKRHEFTPGSSFLENDVYNKGQFEIFESLLARCNVWIAANPADTWHCYGFIIAEEEPDAVVLHYIYVKGTYRRMGVASALLAELLDTQKKLIRTHHTTYWFNLSKWLEKQGFRPIYNPYLAR